MTERRLIEEWLPITELGIESLRERTPMTPFPAPNRLHVWWARRPLIASRAAVLASLLPATADHERFLHALGIHGDPVASRKRIDAAERAGERFEGQAYDYPRAFTYAPSAMDKDWMKALIPMGSGALALLDPTAGGGSVPFEAERLGLSTYSNDLNPVAAIILHATIHYPASFGLPIVAEFRKIADQLIEKREEILASYFPAEPDDSCIPSNYLYSRTVSCPYCDGLIPLSPNWRLSSDGTGIRLLPELASGPLTPGRVCRFEIVKDVEDHSEATVNDGDARCPFPDCGRVVDSSEIKRQAQAGGMGEQLYTIIYKRRIETRTKTGKVKEKWIRGFRVPRSEDANGDYITEQLAAKLPDWLLNEIVPNEAFPEEANDDRPIQYGMPLWRDMFSPRQLLCHGTNVQVFRELLEADRDSGALNDLRKAAYVYLALSLDKLRDYNSRLTRWHVNREVVVNTFDRHDFSFKWSYVEMAPLVVGLGYDWAIDQTAKCIEELVALVRPEEAAATKLELKSSKRSAKGVEIAFPPYGGAVESGSVKVYVPPPVTITCKSGWRARLELCHWKRETLDKESLWDEARSTNLSRW